LLWGYELTAARKKWSNPDEVFAEWVGSKRIDHKPPHQENRTWTYAMILENDPTAAAVVAKVVGSLLNLLLRADKDAGWVLQHNELHFKNIL
jgi:hypothetical protein